jgi:hypothetical protein
MNVVVEIGKETPIFLFWEYLFQNFGIFSLQCKKYITEFLSCCHPCKFMSAHGFALLLDKKQGGLTLTKGLASRLSLSVSCQDFPFSTSPSFRLEARRLHPTKGLASRLSLSVSWQDTLQALLICK